MRKSLLVAALVTGVAGCGSSDEEAGGLGAPPAYPVPGCEHIDHHPCDIRRTPCQERLMQLAACLRGSEPLPVPPVTSMTTDEFVAYLNQNIAQNPPPDPNHYEIALTMLGLVQPGALGQEELIARDVEFVWGIYRYDENDVIIVDHGVAADEADPNSVLVHEFVHALQDNDVDLKGYFREYATNDDTFLGAASVSEGEARLHQVRFWSSLIGLDPASIDWTERFQNVVDFREEQLLLAPSPYAETFSYFPYELGARFVHHAWREGGLSGVDRLFASPPGGSWAVMASRTSVVNADWSAPEFSTPEAPAPWTPWGDTSLGAWGLFLYLESRTTLALDAARSLAHEWRGDKLDVYVDGDTGAQTAVAWRLELASEASAELIESLVRDPTFRPESVLREGTRVGFAHSTGTSSLDWALVP